MEVDDKRNGCAFASLMFVRTKAREIGNAPVSRALYTSHAGATTISYRARIFVEFYASAAPVVSVCAVVAFSSAADAVVSAAPVVVVCDDAAAVVSAAAPPSAVT